MLKYIIHGILNKVSAVVFSDILNDILNDIVSDMLHVIMCQILYGTQGVTL